MIRNVLKTSFGLSILSHDSLKHETKTEKKADLSVTQNETGWERVQKMFEIE